MLRLLVANGPGNFPGLHAHFIVRWLENDIESNRLTYDLPRQTPGATEVSTSSYGDEIIKGMSA